MRWLIGVVSALVLTACDTPLPPPAPDFQELVVAARESPTTWFLDADQQPSSFEYDLVAEFARVSGLRLRIVPLASDAAIYQHLKVGKAHAAVGWLSAPTTAPEFKASRPYFHSRMALAQHEAALAIDTPEKLQNRLLIVATGSHLVERLNRLRAKLPGLSFAERDDRSGLDLLRAVAEQKIEVAVVDELVFDVAQNLFPELQASTLIGDAQPISWLFAPNAPADLLARVDDFLSQAERDGTLERLKDRHFGHIRRLTPNDALVFLERVRTRLPKYQALFKQAQVRSGVDWRLIAALAYQESHWEPLATSPTGVRGMMMLTGDTADRLHVSDRLDAKQSILAGADYLADLRDELPAAVQEPDRTWLALAAYNLGMGHLNGGRAIAPSVKADPNVWYEMKRVLPLMARPEVYARLKSGRARGGEAVIMVENIRAYYDILKRQVPSYDPLPASGETVAQSPPVGLKPATADTPGLKIAPPLPPRKAAVQRIGEMTSNPPIYGRSTSGIAIVPSAY